eukprot:SAG31_NODE_31_length_32474_cov_18.308139_2_plen_274_part_00
MSTQGTRSPASTSMFFRHSGSLSSVSVFCALFRASQVEKIKPVKTARSELKKSTEKQRKYTVKETAVSRSRHSEESLNGGAGKLIKESRAGHISWRDPKRKAKYLNCKDTVSCKITKATLKRPPSHPTKFNSINIGERSDLSSRSASKVDAQPIDSVGDPTCPFCPTHDEIASASPGQGDETESMSFAMDADDLSITVGTLKSKRRRRTQKLGRWWRKYGYNGPPYCQRCADTFSNHVMRKLTSTSVCSPSKLCQCCDKIASYLPAGQISKIP